MTMEPLNVLVGEWEIHGRTPDADEDNVSGTLSVVPALGGTVL